METFLLIIIFISGIITVGSIAFMQPKGGLGIIGGGMGLGGDEYGSKKSFESTLKTVALSATVIFVLSCLLYPLI